MLEEKHQNSRMLNVSVIIPSLDGSRAGNVPKLLDDLSEQTIQPLDIHVVKGVKPNGLARNVGAKKAKGNILVFLDDDIRLGHERIIENLILPLIDDNSIGMTGASIQIPEDSSWFQKATAKQTERNEFPVMDKITESDMVLTACCALPISIFKKLDGFNEDLQRGIDPELRHRIRETGYKIIIVPNSWFYHPLPRNFWQLMKMYYRNGKSSAFGRKMYSELVYETPDKHIGDNVKTRSFVIRIMRFIFVFIKSIFYLRWIQLIAKCAYLTGYILEVLNG